MRCRARLWRPVRARAHGERRRSTDRAGLERVALARRRLSLAVIQGGSRATQAVARPRVPIAPAMAIDTIAPLDRRSTRPEHTARAVGRGPEMSNASRCEIDRSRTRFPPGRGGGRTFRGYQGGRGGFRRRAARARARRVELRDPPPKKLPPCSTDPSMTPSRRCATCSTTAARRPALRSLTARTSVRVAWLAPPPRPGVERLLDEIDAHLRRFTMAVRRSTTASQREQQRPVGSDGSRVGRDGSADGRGLHGGRPRRSLVLRSLCGRYRSRREAL